MIEVRHLTKTYDGNPAVTDLSFKIDRGKIYGFLGPNGAGKTTTMNMLCGYLGATSGDVLIDGHSILDEPLEAKRLIGYLPEQPPLYPEMTVSEYLRFAAQIKGIRRGQAAEIERASKTAGLGEVQGRLIGNLSKGYRQRVGLAQALLGLPPIIILDEPTAGLDPKQIIEMRALIKSLGREHTVILSSHILSEISAVCDECLIISRGRLVATGTPEALEDRLRAAAMLELTARCSAKQAEALLFPLFPKRSVTCRESGNGLCSITLQTEGEDRREAIFFAFADSRVPILEMHRARATLEDVFLDLTADTEENGETKDASSRCVHAPLHRAADGAQANETGETEGESV